MEYSLFTLDFESSTSAILETCRELGVTNPRDYSRHGLRVVRIVNKVWWTHFSGWSMGDHWIPVIFLFFMVYFIRGLGHPRADA